jgi:SAM-dependent methyltransferase
MPPHQAVIDRWSGAAPFWEKHREMICRMFAPVTEALVDDAGIASGHTVLDVATGPGEPALGVAAVVGPHGKVVGVDPIPEMVAAACRTTTNRGVTNAQFHVAFADDLPFPTGAFDAVISRFGVMFFPSPLHAVREMLRVLRPGGTVALAVWDLPDRNPFFHIMSNAIERYIESPPFDPDAPDAFRFAAPGKLCNVLSEAGALSPAERLLPFTIQAPVSPEDFWSLRCEMSEKLREKVAALSSDQLTNVKSHVLDSLRGYSNDGMMNLPAQILIVTGTKNASAH